MNNINQRKKKFTMEITEKNHKQLKVFAANNDISMKGFVEDAIHHYAKFLKENKDEN